MPVYNPSLVFDTREYDEDYKQAMEGSFFTRLCFREFGVKTTEPERAVGDITDTTHAGAIEVKTKNDLAGSVLDGRFQWQVWNLFLLRSAGAIVQFAVLIRGMDEPLIDVEKYQHYPAEKREKIIAKIRFSWKVARLELFSLATRFGFDVLFADDPADTVDTARSWLKKQMEKRDTLRRPMPEPYVPRELLDQPPIVRALASTVPNFGAKRASMLAGEYSIGEFANDVLMDRQFFIENYRDRYGFDDKLLGNVWDAWNERVTVPEIAPRTFQMTDREYIP